MGNCTEITYADGSIATATYDSMGRVVTANIEVTDILTGEERTLSESYTYDTMGNVASHTDTMGNVTYYEYDLNNQLIKATDSEGNIEAEYTYDCMGRILQVKNSDGILTTYTYNVSGQVATVSQMAGNGEERTYTYTYDTMGRLLSVTDPAGVTTSQSYDSGGNITEVTYPQGGGISYSYDEYGRLTTETLSIGTQTTYEYNGESQLSIYTNGRGQETAYTYDELGRTVSFTDELGTVSYTYDGNGNVLTVTETLKDGTESTISRTYDSMNRVATYTDYNGNTIKYGYDELGNIVSLTYPGGEIVRYSYYDNGLMSCMVDGEGYKTSYTYDSYGRETSIVKPDGSVETKTYNDKGYLATVTLEAAGEEIYSYIYTYDEWGNITNIIYESQSEEETDLSTLTSSTMTYDECNRMVTYNGEEVLYDEDGNMVYGPLDGEMVTFTYDCRNRLVEAGDTTYEYDAEYIRTAVETPEYREEYVTDSVTTLSRVLEVERTYKQADEESTTIVGTTAELVTTGTVVKEEESTTYYYGNGLIYEKNDTQGLLVYHYDHLGSTKLVTDSQGNTVATCSYGTYGELLTDTTEYDITTRFLYNGELGVVTDDNGLYYMRSRYYNPEIKRFINQDILTGNIGNNKSLNRYSYVEGNPVSYTDPFGLSPYKAMGHATLDVIGIFCPIADVINAAWYFLDGEAGEGAKCLVYSATGMNIYGTLTKFTTKGSKAYKAAATVEDIIAHGVHAGTITFVSYDTGKLGGDLFEKYFVDGAEVTGETAAEIATLLLTGTQLGFSIKNGISFNGKMYADDVLDMSGVKVVDDVSISNSTDVVDGGWDNNGYLNITEVKGGTNADLGNKLDYQFGKAGGNKHNVDRTTGLKAEMDKLGFDDTPENRAYFEQYYNDVLNDSSNIVGKPQTASYVESGVTYNYTVTTRESFLMGKYGGAKVTTHWDGNRLLTIKIGSGKQTRYHH